MRQLDSVTDVLRALGGAKAVWTLCGVKRNNVYNWKAFGKFPPRYFKLMTDELERRDCHAPASLWGME